jgi:perosamine synthetase
MDRSTFKIPLARPEIDDGDRAAVARVLATDQLAMGPELERFESKLADAAGTRYALAVSSGTAGLYLVLRALGVGPGDEVVTVSYTFVGTVNAVIMTGARPVLVDVSDDSLNLDPARLPSAIGPRTKAVLVVHLFGRPADIPAISAICNPLGIPVVEDACESLGSAIGDRPVGGMGRAGVFGFYPNKPITTGEGGAVVSNDADLVRTCRALANQGRDPVSGDLGGAGFGFNFRMSELNAALGASQLSRLVPITERRRSVAARYDRALSNLPIVRPPIFVPEVELSWFVYVVRLPGDTDRDAVRAMLAARGIQTAVYFPAVHTLSGYESYRQSNDALPVSEDAAGRCLALPFWFGMGDEQINEVRKSLVEALGV